MSQQSAVLVNAVVRIARAVRNGEGIELDAEETALVALLITALQRGGTE